MMFGPPDTEHARRCEFCRQMLGEDTATLEVITDQLAEEGLPKGSQVQVQCVPFVVIDYLMSFCVDGRVCLAFAHDIGPQTIWLRRAGSPLTPVALERINSAAVVMPLRAAKGPGEREVPAVRRRGRPRTKKGGLSALQTNGGK